MKKKPKTISRAELARLSFCNSPKMPQVINDNGHKKSAMRFSSSWRDDQKRPLVSVGQSLALRIVILCVFSMESFL